MINTAVYLRTLIRNRPRRAPRARSGMIFVTALGICVVLGGLALIFAASMRTEALASANRLSYVQADAIEQGAEQYVLAQIDTYTTDAMNITSQQQVPAQSVQVGNGYFWIIRPNDSPIRIGISESPMNPASSTLITRPPTSCWPSRTSPRKSPIPSPITVAMPVSPMGPTPLITTASPNPTTPNLPPMKASRN